MEITYKDSLGRRLRDAPPQSTGKKVNPARTGRLVMQALDDHRFLSKKQLFEFAKHAGIKNQSEFGQCIANYYNEDNAPCGGQYIYKPSGQWQVNPLERRSGGLEVVYGNNLSAWRYLESIGDIEPRPANHWHDVKNFWHAYGLSSVTASIHLACLERGLPVTWRRQVIGNNPLTFDVPIEFEGEYYEGKLEPDSLGVVELPSGPLYFFVEFDRMSEHVNVTNLKNTSYRRKLLQYRKLVGDKLYMELLGVDRPVPIVVLHVTTNHDHMQTMIKCMLKITEGKGNNYNWFRFDDAFGDKPYIPAPSPTYGFDLWQRAGREPIALIEA